MSFLRRLGRAIDPTNKNAPLGGVTRAAIGYIPGGSTVLGTVDTINAARRGGTDRSSTTERSGAATPAEVTPGTPAGPAAPARAPSSWRTWATKPAVLIGAGVAVVLVVLLVFRRK